ncbi:ABC transporter ATP-binding protein/permease [Flavobacteriaceae bacterium LSUCC0859]|nr:ABC transporter ATP-binding protein/permease [Flavobacteriaceae bacterium LSUCC0859]
MLSTLKKINFLITKRQRKGLVILTFLLFIGMIFELFGLGILLPVLTIITDPNLIDTNIYLVKFAEIFELEKHSDFILFALISLIVFYLIKTIFLVILSFIQNRFLANIISTTARTLFSRYLSLPYNFFLKRNSSGLIKNFQVELHNYWNFWVAFLALLTETLFLISFVAILIYIEPFGAIATGFFLGIISILIYQITKSKLKLWGLKREESDIIISQTLTETFGSIKDIMLLDKGRFFKNIFDDSMSLKTRVWSNNATISQFPKLFFEFLAVLSLALFIIIQLYQGKDVKIIIPVLGVFVASTFKIIPSLNRILSSFQTLKFYLPSVDIYFNEFKIPYQSFESNILSQARFSHNLEIVDLSFGYSKSEDLVFKELNFTIFKGEKIGIVGSSGSGKSTLVDLLMGLYSPVSGEIKYDGINIYSNLKSWQKNIGYVPQDIFLLDDSIKNNICFGISNSEIDNIKLWKAINDSQLTEFVNNLENGVESKVGERGVQISGGQRQRIGIARALYNNPNILILDEATSALDNETEKEIINSVKNLKDKTVIMIAHRLTTLVDCDRIFELINGRLSIKSNTF